jgi:O-antigen/teichoic acid export membrane protein
VDISSHGSDGFDLEPSSSRDAPQSGKVSRERLHRAAKLIISFFLGQGALQTANLLAALFLVRTLSLEAYAQFGVAYAFQATFMTMMDLGFVSTIIPLVGSRSMDRKVVGRYVRAAKHLRDRAFWGLAPFAAGAFLAAAYKRHWSWHLNLLLLASVLLSLYSGGHVSCFSAPFFIYRRLRQYYLPQTLSAFGRLAGYIALRFAGGLNAWTAAGLSALNITVNGVIFEKDTRPLMEWPDREDPAADREVLKYILPATPAFLFQAFQTQISLLLITIFGQTTNIAQVAALGRIGSLFLVLGTFNSVVIEPYMARLSSTHLLATYLRFFLAAAGCCVPVVLFSFIFPRPILWLLGPKYEGLGSLVGWVVLSSCIGYLASLLWAMNRARRWVFWSGTVLEIALLVIVQSVFAALVGVSTTRDAILFSFASSFCYLAAHGYVAVYGFLKGPRVTLAEAI